VGLCNAVKMWTFFVSVSGFSVPLGLGYSSWSMFFRVGKGVIQGVTKMWNERVRFGVTGIK